MRDDYPIQPKHLDTEREPKGFDAFLDHGQRLILWTLMQCWQAKGDWNGFTHDEFLAFIDNPMSGVPEGIRAPVIRFVEPRLESILDYRKIIRDGKETCLYAPTHFLVSTYFHWNPAD